MFDQPPHTQKAETYVYDPPRRRIRRIDDLVWVMINLVLIGIILLAGNYARRTTAAVANDVVGVVTNTTFDQILFLPLTFLQNIFLLIVPLVLIARLLQQRRWEALWQATCTGIFSGIVAVGVDFLLIRLPDFLRESLLVWGVSKQIIAVPTMFVATSAMITFVGDRARDRWIRSLWHGTWAILLIAVLQIRMTLTSAVLTVLLGNSLGLLARYLFGFQPRRAGTKQIIAALYQIGIKPKIIWRFNNIENDKYSTIWSNNILRCYEYEFSAVDRVNIDSFQQRETQISELSIQPQERESLREIFGKEIKQDPGHRLLRSYRIWDEQGNRFLLYAGDQDTQMLNWLKDLWSNMRWRGLQHATNSNHRKSGEYAAMMAMLVERYQIRSRPYYGMVQAGESILNVYEDTIVLHKLVDDPIFSEPIKESADLRISDEETSRLMVLRELWQQVLRAHRFDLTHRNLDLSSIQIDEKQKIYLLDWEQGEAASSELSKALDLVQILVFSAYLIGARGAVQLAQEFLPIKNLLKLLPVCQNLALPPEIKEKAKSQKLLPQLTQTIIDLAQKESFDRSVENELLEAENKAVKLRRFSVKSLLLAVFGVLALSIILGSLNFQELRHLIWAAQPGWMTLGFLCALAMSVGQSWSLQALSPKRLRFFTTYLVQLAGSLTALVAPAGLGSATLNAKYLSRHKNPIALSIATVTVHQSIQILGSFVTLFIMVLFTGNSLNVQRPSTTLLLTIAVSALMITILLTIPKLRQYFWDFIGPTLKTIVLRLNWIWSSPRRILGAIGGTLLQIIVQIACFYCALAAFGASIPLATLTVTFLISNSLGSIIPTPGGIGPVEAALTAGLKVAGVPAQTALAAALLYRLLTFWLRAILGWGALKVLQHQGNI